MPPKPKFTKEEVAAAALALVKECGVSALTARELGKRLGTSASPIFTVFKSMDEVKWAARARGLREFEEYAGDFGDYTPAFKRIGMLMVSYAIHQPEMFKLLFMQEHPDSHSFADSLRDLGCMADTCIRLIQRDYALSPEQSQLLFEQMWVHAFGMGALCAMKVCDFSEDEISEKLGQVFAGMLVVIQSGMIGKTSPLPVKDSGGVFQKQPVNELPFFSGSEGNHETT